MPQPSAAERQLILIAAGTAARRREQATHAARLAAAVEWQRLSEALTGRRLLTVLGPRIVELGGSAVATSFATEVAAAVAAGRRQGTLLQTVSARAIAVLAVAGIRAAALKGPALAEAVYADLGRRPSSDVDLIVPAERIDDAAAAVRSALGYAEPADPRDRYGLPRLHLALAHERGELPPLELHWRIHWYEREFGRERLLPPGLDPTGEWRPAPSDQLAALLLFYARDGFTDLRIATDIGAWWDAFGAGLPPDALAATTDAYPALRPAIGSAALVAEELVGLPARQLLGARFRARRRDRLAVRFANPHPEETTPAQHFADRGLVDGLLTPRGGLRAFVDRQLLPSDAVLEQQAAFLGRARARGRAARFLGTLGRYGVRLGGRAAGRRDEPQAHQLPLAVPVSERVRIMGMAIGPGAEGDVVAEIVDAVERGRGHWTVTANLDHLRRYNSEPVARELIAAADLAIADGMPLVWASRIAGTPLPERITGSNLIPPLCRAAAERGLGVVMLGGDEGAGEQAAAALRERYEGLEVRDAICPPYGFEHDEEQLGAIERRLAAAAPGLVFVGLGFPKQDIVIRRLRAVVPGAAYIGIGNALSFFSGDVSRAPEWARDNGLEWLHRVIVEPRRRDLAHRYLVQGAPFALRMLGSAAAYRLDPGRATERWGRWQPPRLELQPPLPAGSDARAAEAA